MRRVVLTVIFIFVLLVGTLPKAHSYDFTESLNLAYDSGYIYGKSICGKVFSDVYGGLITKGNFNSYKSGEAAYKIFLICTLGSLDKQLGKNEKSIYVAQGNRLLNNILK